MKETNLEEIIKTAKSYCEEKIPWRHHFLTLNCIFNKSNKFQIILENESSGESFVAMFAYKPTKELELFENLFFGREN